VRRMRSVVPTCWISTRFASFFSIVRIEACFLFSYILVPAASSINPRVSAGRMLGIFLIWPCAIWAAGATGGVTRARSACAPMLHGRLASTAHHKVRVVHVESDRVEQVLDTVGLRVGAVDHVLVLTADGDLQEGRTV
jgi:hypothetical protein